MNIGKYIKDHIKNQGRTVKWVADQLKMNPQTLFSKLNRGGLSAEDLIRLSILLNINLNKLKEEMNMPNTPIQKGELKAVILEYEDKYKLNLFYEGDVPHKSELFNSTEDAKEYVKHLNFTWREPEEDEADGDVLLIGE